MGCWCYLEIVRCGRFFHAYLFDDSSASKFNAIQQQNRVATAQMMQSRGDTLINFFSLGINDEKALNIFSGIFQRPDLDSTREWLVVNTARAMWENLFYQYREGFLPEDFYNQGVATGIRLAGPKFLEMNIPMQTEFKEEILRLLRARRLNEASLKYQ